MAEEKGSKTQQPEKKTTADQEEAAANPPPQQTSSKKAPAKKAASKKAAPKKAAAKKASAKKAVSKKAATKKADTTGSQKATAGSDEKTLLALSKIVNEIREDNQARDRHLSTLIQEMSKGFDGFATQTQRTDSEREREMARLYQNLDDAFAKAEDSDKAQEDRTMTVVKALSESIMSDHENTLKEVQEQKMLQDKQIEHLTKLAEQRSGRNRWIAVPAVIIAIIGIFYMFYVVSVMESAMISMSTDMHSMRASVSNMSDKMDVMSMDTSSMKDNMLQLNRNIGQMSRDLNILTYHVSPTMKGFSDLMPWK